MEPWRAGRQREIRKDKFFLGELNSDLVTILEPCSRHVKLFIQLSH